METAKFNEQKNLIAQAILQEILKADPTSNARIDESISSHQYEQMSQDRIYFQIFAHRVDVKISEDRSVINSWHSKPTGKLSVTTGDYGNRHRYPQRKDGSHKYEEIAFFLIQEAKVRMVEQAAEFNRINNKSQIEDWKLQHPSFYSFYFFASSDPKKPVTFKATMTENLTLEQATKLYDVLKELGMV